MTKYREPAEEELSSDDFNAVWQAHVRSQEIK